jgi:hypothetical protein
MQVKQAKDYFKNDLIVELFLQPEPFGQVGWTIGVAGKKDQQWFIKTALDKVKVYTSLDTAYKEIKGIIGRDFTLSVGVTEADNFSLTKSK